MQTDTAGSFRENLVELGVGVTETTPEDCAAVVDDLLRPPAVGVPLPDRLGDLPAGVATSPTTAELDAATTGVTPAVLGVADYGSVLLESDAAGTEPASVYPEFHVAVLHVDDLVPDMPVAFERLGPRLREGRGSVVFATGPSATADMGALVRGAHGPREVHVVLVGDPDDSANSADVADSTDRSGDDAEGEGATP